MNPVLIGVIGMCVMILIILLGMPVGFSMAIAGFLGITYLVGFNVALPILHRTFYQIVSNYQFTVIPFFILMGYFAAVSGITSDLYLTAEKWLRKLPGGLALASIAGCAGFASICGSSQATAATMSAVALPEMKKYGYDPALSSGTLAAGGTLGFLIPPSGAFVVYGIITEQSVGQLLIAGFLPGFVLALAFMLIIVIRVKMNPKLAPTNPETVAWRERLASIKDVWGVVLVFLMVMGGIYLGFFTPTEAGAVGAFILLIFAAGRRRLNFRNLFDSLVGTAGVTCMIFVIIFGAYIFSSFLALSRIPPAMMSLIGGLDVSPNIVLAIIIMIFLILGCFIEAIPMIILIVPLVLPILENLGFHPVWFGVISVLMVEAALITPPVGNNVYIISGVAKDIPAMTIFRGALPFLISIILVVIILVAFPEVALFLPNKMIG